MHPIWIPVPASFSCHRGQTRLETRDRSATNHSLWCESMALHSSAAPCYGASAIAGACGAQVLALRFVCPSVRPSSVRRRLVCSLLPRWVLGAPVSWICVVWLALRCQPRAPLQGFLGVG